MTIGSILLGLALLGLVALFVARPLLKPAPRSVSKVTTYDALIAQKEAILTQIRSLDFDYETGKLTDEDYHRQREEFLVSAEEIFRRLDEIEQIDETTGPAAVVAEVGGSSDLESEIEAAIARRRTKQATAAVESEQPQYAASNGETKYCPDCGKQADLDDKFCVNCGHKLLNPKHA